MARPEKIRLGEILLQQDLLSADQLMIALEEQKRTGRKLGRIFVESGFLTEKQISEAMARQLKIPFIDLMQFDARADIVQKLPEVQARRLRAIVLEEHASTYLVGLVDPTDLFAYDEITRILQRDIELAVVQEGSLLQVIDKSYGNAVALSALALNASEIVLDFSAPDVAQNTEDASVFKLLQTIFDDAVQVHASDIHIEPQEHHLHIRFRIDGVMHLQMQADATIATALALRLKLMSRLDISENRLPQDGRFSIKINQLPVDVRISTMPAQYGESVVMRLLIQNSSGFSLEKSGMPADMLARFRKLIHKPAGMVLVTGPTGSGRTTILYAVLNELNSPANKIITVEDPVEYRLPGINQVQVNDRVDLDFARVLRAILRQDPDIILLGEMRDQETAQLGLRAAMTGHLVLSTLHTNDAATAPMCMLDMGVPKFMVTTSLLGVLAVRLLRLNCPDCVEEYIPQAYELAWLEHELGDAVARHRYLGGKGCEHCSGTGYQGRLGVYELLEMNGELVDAANHQDTQVFIQSARRKMAGRTLRSQAVQLVLEGRTTIAEAMRIRHQLED